MGRMYGYTGRTRGRREDEIVRPLSHRRWEESEYCRKGLSQIEEVSFSCQLLKSVDQSQTKGAVGRFMGGLENATHSSPGSACSHSKQPEGSADRDFSSPLFAERLICDE